MSAKRILEKYAEQRDTLPTAIDAALKNVTKNTAKPKVTMWQDKELPFMMMRIEVE